MLSATIKTELDILGLLNKGPVVVSPKIDGIRAIHKDGYLQSRTLKPIPNNFIQKSLQSTGLNGVDGELLVDDETAPDVFQKSTSGIMSTDGEPNFTYYLFDMWLPENETYANRFKTLGNVVQMYNSSNIIRLPSFVVTELKQVKYYEEKYLSEGYEGLMIRYPNSPYKYGRSTLKEGYLVKLKRFVDSEAKIVGFEEEMENQNKAFTNELGRTARSTEKDGMVGKNTLGALIVNHNSFGEFNIGSGLNDEWRKKIWNNKDYYWGKYVTFKYFEIGIVNKPRHPVFKGFRDKIDM